VAPPVSMEKEPASLQSTNVVDNTFVSGLTVVEETKSPVQPQSEYEARYDLVEEPKTNWGFVWTCIALAAAVVVGWILSQQ